eukprot:scpid31162/ scgid15748/ Beta-galactosidase; Lactase
MHCEMLLLALLSLAAVPSLAVKADASSSDNVPLSAHPSPTRETINFDFAWRHFSTPVDGSGGPFLSCRTAFTPFENTTCYGVRLVSVFSSADDCQTLCCLSRYCRAWMYDIRSGACSIDSEREFSCEHPTNDYTVGGTRPAPGPLPPVPEMDASRLQYDFDDSEWEIVNAPHDSLLGQEFSENASSSQGNLPYQFTFYRKHFNLPSDWEKAGQVSVYFEGIFRSSLVYLNSIQINFHESGYTSFAVRLDNVTGVKFGAGKENENVLAIRAQAFGGSGWWYEGGGLYRHNYLIFHSNIHIATNGILASLSPDVASIRQLEDGRTTTADASLHVRATVRCDAESGNEVNVTFQLYDAANKLLVALAANGTYMKPGDSFVFFAEHFVENVTLWSPTDTYMYRVATMVSAGGGVVSDIINDTYVGARSAQWHAGYGGFVLNGEPFKWRGFCNHNDLAGVGTGIPDRLHLFRAQAMKSVGGNSWRMSHNPPAPALLSVLDELAILVWDETRNFGDERQWVQDIQDMVERDRNHPSVMLWSFCNEGGCLQHDPDVASIGGQFRGSAKAMDPFRPVTANMVAKTITDLQCPLTGEVDVQGFSHMQGFIFDDFYDLYPNIPVINSECCSCVTQRGEDTADETHLANFNADCISEQSARGITRPFVSGSLVWTLFDYLGEPTPVEWPHVSSSFGSFDLAGFSKAAAFWYRAWWLYNFTHPTGNDQSTTAKPTQLDIPRHAPSLIDPQVIDKNSISSANSGVRSVASASPSDSGDILVHIVQHWEPNIATAMGSDDLRTIQVYSNAPHVQLNVNGKTVGTQFLQWYGWAQFSNVLFEPGNLTSAAFSSSGKVVATHTRLTCGAADSIQLVLDVPSASTGTGTALVLDGQDTGMIRALIVDEKNSVVQSSSHNVTFTVTGGPGRIIGVGNGDPACHEANKATSRSAYHGVVRAVIQVTLNSAMPVHVRRRLAQIDAESNHYTYLLNPGEDTHRMGEMKQAGDTTTAAAIDELLSADSITVEATSPGLKSATISIPVSNDFEGHNVMATANAWMEQR